MCNKEFDNILKDKPSVPWDKEFILNDPLNTKKEITHERYKKICDLINRDIKRFEDLKVIINNYNNLCVFCKLWKELLVYNWQDMQKIILGKNEFSHELRVSSPMIKLLTEKERKLIKGRELTIK
jgi:hypothetical protein